MDKSAFKREELQRALTPPPRFVPLPENGPIIEPPFRNVARLDLEQPTEWEPFYAEAVGQDAAVLAPEIAVRARTLAIAHERVAKFLAGKDHVVIGASLRENKEGKTPREILVVIYNYADNEVLEVSMDHSSLNVNQVQQARYQPAPVEEELKRAVELARKSEALAKNLTEDLIGMAILVGCNDPSDPRHGHRMFDVRFGCADERLPRFMAIVDLSTREVVHSGPLEGHCGGGHHG